jgi:hypothetical protein
MKTNRSYLAVVAALALAVGCASDPAVVTGHGSPLFGPNFPALPMAASSVLEMPSPDCAGRLTTTATLNFEVASLQAGLVAVVDGGGNVVCVDTVSDVQSDLNASGQSAEAAAVVDGFIAAMRQSDARAARFSGRALHGDPEPQPNSQPGRLPDPEPQPN